MNFNLTYKTLKIIVIFVLLFCSASKIFGQTYYFKQYSVEQGLVQARVEAICQDKKGYLWIGTVGGLSRFDGSQFVNYSVNDGNTGQERLFFYLEALNPGLSSQSYSSTGGGAWTVAIIT